MSMGCCVAQVLSSSFSEVIGDTFAFVFIASCCRRCITTRHNATPPTMVNGIAIKKRMLLLKPRASDSFAASAQPGQAWVMMGNASRNSVSTEQNTFTVFFITIISDQINVTGDTPKRLDKARIFSTLSSRLPARSSATTSSAPSSGNCDGER